MGEARGEDSGPGATLRWVRGVALACFCAGVLVGLAVPGVVDAVRGPVQTADPDEQYVRDFAAKYGLDKAQIRTLRMILADDLASTTAIIRAKPETLPPEVLKLRRRTDERIRVMLSDEQRAQYLRDTNPDAGTTPNGSSTDGPTTDRNR